MCSYLRTDTESGGERIPRRYIKAQENPPPERIGRRGPDTRLPPQNRAALSRSHSRLEQDLLAVCFNTSCFSCFPWNGILWRRSPTWLPRGSQQQQHFRRIGRGRAVEYFGNSEAKGQTNNPPPPTYPHPPLQSQNTFFKQEMKIKNNY